MTLQLLICTFNDGIHDIPHLLLPPLEDVSYLVSWQQSSDYSPCELPHSLLRPDVQVEPLAGLGLSRNRNNCLKYASGDICLICDDDCRYTPQGLAHVVEVFETDSTLDLATFKAKNDFEPRFYPDFSFDLRKKVKNYSPISFEIAFRRTSIVGKLQFNEHFGLGADLFGAGEENLFVDDAMRLGLQCHYFPQVIVEHPGPTTCTSRIASPAVLRANGALIYRLYRPTMLLRAPLLAWRLNRQFRVPLFFALKHIAVGIYKMFRLSCNSH